MDLKAQSTIQLQSGQTIYIAYRAFWNLLSFEIGYETNISGISGAANFHVVSIFIELFVYRNCRKSAGPYIE